MPCAAPSRPRRWLLATLVVLAAGGRGGRADEPQARTRPFGVHERNPARFAVDEARRLLTLGELDAAFERVHEALAQYPDSLYLVEQTPESERWRPVSLLLDELLTGLAEPARRRYEAFVRPRTDPLRRAAAEDGDERALTLLSTTYATSAAGREALALRASLAYERGQREVAAALGREAVRRSPQDAGAWWRLAQVLADLGDAGLLARMEPPAGLVAMTAAGPVDVAAHWESLRRRTPVPAASGWPTWGGDAARGGAVRASASGSAPTRSGGLRWTARTLLTRRERDEPGGWGEGEGDDQLDFEQHLDSYFPMFPCADTRALYVSDGRSLRALDLYGGRVLWALEERTPRLPLLGPDARLLGRSALDRPFAPTLWRDLVISTLEVEHPYAPDWVINVQINTYMPERTLVALDRERGTLRWRAGEHPQDARVMADVHLCAEAAVEDGVVVVAGARYEHLQNVSLFGFDAATGRLRWETPVAYGNQETNLFGNPVKEFSAGCVSARDGVAYSTTGLGCLAAVRVSDGRLQWVASYEIEPMQPVQMWFQPRLRIPHWAPTAPLVTEDLVVVAPGDGLHVSAFRRADGSLAWRSRHADHPVPTFKLRQVIGPATVGGRPALLVAGRHVTALDLANGRAIARGRFDPESSEMRGQGVVRGREVLVPTDAGLQRFSLDGELKLLGREAWGQDAGPGNLMALGHALVVARFPEVQGHYAWEDVERELQRRRRERPDDPEVLLEAGELYLRGRGPAEARAAFQSALGLSPEGSVAARRARRGLYASWLEEGDQRAGEEPARGAGAWRHALETAQTAAERIAVRLRLDGALAGRHAERVRNLEALYEEAGDERAAFEGTAVQGSAEPLPVRAVTLLRLAQLEEEARRGREAVAALQRLLEEHGDVRLGSEPARVVARERIEQLIERFGREVYAPFEARARREVEQARARGDGAALERALSTWPNAQVVPSALLALARTQLAEGRAEEAAEAARRLVAAHAGTAEALSGHALLLEAYRRLDARGALRGVAAALATLPSGQRVALADGASTVGALLAGCPPAAGTDAREATLALPLTERSFDPPDDEEVTMPVGVVEEAGRSSPIGLTSRGGALHGYDLEAGGRVWSLPDTICQRAAYADGTLVLALRGELRAVDLATGATLWRRPAQRAVHELAVAHGTLVLWGQDPSLPGAPRVLEAYDPTTGLPLWSQRMGHEHGHGLRAAAGRLLLYRTRTENGEARTRLLVFDLVSGALRHELPLPGSRDRADLTVDRLWLGGGEGVAGAGRRVRALDVVTGKEAWVATLGSPSPVGALASEGDRVWALQQDGTLTAIERETGAIAHVTRIEVGADARALPVHGTEIQVRAGQLALLAYPVRGAPPLLAFDTRTGKLRWAVEGQPLARTQMHTLVRRGERLVVLLAGQDGRNVRRVLLRLVDATSGRVEQEIEPAWGNGGGIVGLSAGAQNLLVVSGAGTSLYGAGPAPAPAPGRPAAR